MFETAIGGARPRIQRYKNKNRSEVLEMIENSISPHFVRLPRDKFVVAHQTAIIKARINATPKPQVRWYKNMKPIFDGPRIKVQKINKKKCWT